MEILAEILVFSKTLLQIFKDLSLMLHFPSQVIMLLLLNTPLKVQITYRTTCEYSKIRYRIARNFR